jgi:tryptophan-rich sensory protein
MFQRFGLTRREGLTALGVILSVNALGALPAVFAGADTNWIDRPWFYPPEILFPIAWTLLFTLMGAALFVVWRHGTDHWSVRVAIGTFALQFALNLAWTPVFFGLQRADLGLVVIVLLWITIAATIVVFARVSRLAAALLVPYLGWVSFAVVLNYAIYAAG